MRFTQEPIPVLDQYFNDYGDTFRMTLGTERIIMTQSPDIIQHILQKNHRLYRKSNTVKKLQKHLGKGLLTSDGPYWLKQRRLMQPGFGRKRMQALFGLMDNEVQLQLKQFDQYSEERKPFDMNKEMMHITMMVIMRSLFSQGMKDDEIKLVDSVISEFQQLIVTEVRNPLKHFWAKLNGAEKKENQLQEQLDKLLYRIIVERKSTFGDFDDLLQMLLDARYEDGEGMNDEQIRDESIVLFIAGHETSSNALSWCFHLLTNHPEIEDKLLAEIKSTVGDRAIQLEDLHSLTYSKAVL
ncbi:cytochrome P450, partial [Chitinophagales bacterium]|nr:cytochrome P450 [Chitinophagales bacterium]